MLVEFVKKKTWYVQLCETFYVQTHLHYIFIALFIWD